MPTKDEMREAVREALKEEKERTRKLIGLEIAPLFNPSLVFVAIMVIITSIMMDTPFESADSAIIAVMVAVVGTILSMGVWILNSYVYTNQKFLEEIMKKLEIQ